METKQPRNIVVAVSMAQDDFDILERTSTDLGVSRSETVRRALRVLNLRRGRYTDA